jgi:8-oxo-dGTP pyrophosphatase MutT (NUDIX family)
VTSLEEIRRALAGHAPATIAAEGAAHAAVALVLRESCSGPELLFIERAAREGDPWSGHMAFPGGRMESVDGCARAAAERETLEEVGMQLRRGEPLGRLDDKPGNPETRPQLVVSAYVYAVGEPGPLVLNCEVREAFWFSVQELLDPVRRVTRTVHDLPFPGILLGERERHVVWGLTYSFLESFFLALGRPLPNRWIPALRPYARGLDARGEPGRDSHRSKT